MTWMIHNRNYSGNLAAADSHARRPRFVANPSVVRREQSSAVITEERTDRSREKLKTELPVNHAGFTRLFAAYSEWTISRNFHSLRLLGCPDFKSFQSRPLVVYANHPSWWDPLAGLVVWRRLMSDRTPFAPIDAAALEKYGFFRKLGFFGVEKNSLSGARKFLRTSRALLNRSDTLLFITPQGRFADVRESSVKFQPGLARLAAEASDAVFLPLAIEYTYWEEKRPEILAHFGNPVDSVAETETQAVSDPLEQRMQSAIEELRSASIRRDPREFKMLVSGKNGADALYDFWRRTKSWVRRETFNPSHGTK